MGGLAGRSHFWDAVWFAARRSYGATWLVAACDGSWRDIARCQSFLLRLPISPPDIVHATHHLPVPIGYDTLAVRSTFPRASSLRANAADLSRTRYRRRGRL